MNYDEWKAKKLKRERFFRKFYRLADCAIKWGFFVAIVVVLCLVANFLNADVALLIAGGALGVSYYSAFIQKD